MKDSWRRPATTCDGTFRFFFFWCMHRIGFHTATFTGDNDTFKRESENTYHQYVHCAVTFKNNKLSIENRFVYLITLLYWSKDKTDWTVVFTFNIDICVCILFAYLFIKVTIQNTTNQVQCIVQGCISSAIMSSKWPSTRMKRFSSFSFFAALWAVLHEMTNEISTTSNFIYRISYSVYTTISQSSRFHTQWCFAIYAQL